MYPSVGAGSAGSSSTRQTMLHEFLQMAQHNGGRSPVLLYHGSSRREGHHLQDPGIFSYFPFPSFTLPFFALSFLLCPSTGKELGREWWVGRKDLGVCKGDC
jgi:hypothetical protein